MQISPNRIVEFSPDEYPNITIGIRPATGPQRTQYMGELGRDGANIGDVAVRICKRHVRTASGDPRLDDFNHQRKDAFDAWEPEWMFAVMQFVVEGCQFTGDDAKNSE